jgi:S-adenosylhomocysteine hydrolase
VALLRNVGVAPVVATKAPAVAAPPPAPASPSKARIDELLEKLPTEAGLALADALIARIAPNLKDEGQLEPLVPLKSPPTNKLDQALVQSLQDNFVNAFAARRNLPAVLAELLLPFVHHGVLDIDKAQGVYGRDLGDWLRHLASIPNGAPSRPTADRMVYEPLSPDQRAKILGEVPSIAPPMEAVDFTLKTYGKPEELEGYQFLGLQHLFASSESLFRALDTLGVDPKDTRIIGKIYSTNMRVVGELQTLGATVDGVSTTTHGEKFSSAMEESIYRQLSGVISKLPKPVSRTNTPSGEVQLVWDPPPRPQALIIDDGAEAIKMLHERFPEYAPFFACVEQTRRGARIAHQLADAGKLKCAVVNVAESWAKLERESPMIGESVVREVERKLDRFEQAGVPKPKEATVVGYGAIGQRVAAALQRRGVTVHIYDSDPNVLKDLPKGMIGHTDKAEALSHGQVLVSCVGARTLFPDDWDALPNGAMLVNAASADDELGPEDLSRMLKGNETFDRHGDLWGVFQGKPVDLGQPDDPAHSDSIVKLEDGKEFLLASNGFVVNMTGERDPIPPKYIQLTRSLLLMGAITATRATKPGLIDVPEDWQKALVAHVEGELAKSGGSLQKPLWDAVIDEPMGEPPASILEIARQEKEGAPPAKGSDEGKIVAEENLGDLTGPTKPSGPKGIVHGYAVGEATDRNSFAWTVAEAMDVPDKDMSVEAWALYHAARHANGALGWHMTVKFNPDEKGRLTAEQLLAPPANQARAAKAPQETQFEAQFGYHVRGLAYFALKSRLKRDPTPAELADAMVKAAKDGKVSLDPFIDYLRTQAQDDIALADALTRAGAAT